MWVKCKDKLPPKNSILKLKYSDGTIALCVYSSDLTWYMQEATVDRSVYVEAWWKEVEPKKTIHWTMFERTTAK